MNTPPDLAHPAAPSAADWRPVIDEFERLFADIATLLQRLETHGLLAQLKDDYLALHALQSRALAQHQLQRDALPALCTAPDHAHPARGQTRQQPLKSTAHGADIC